MTFEALEARVIALESGHRRLADKIEENTKLTVSIKKDTEEIVSIFKTAKGANRSLISFAKWVTAVGGAVAAVWALVLMASGHKIP